MIVDCDHKDTVADVKGVHILLQSAHSLCPLYVRPSFVPQRTLKSCVQALYKFSSISLAGDINKFHSGQRERYLIA